MVPPGNFRMLLKRLTLGYRTSRFNPLTDMEIRAQPVETTDVSSTLAGMSLNNSTETVQLPESNFVPHFQGRFPQSPFVGLGPFFSKDRSNEVRQSSSTLLEADRPGPSRNTSDMEHLQGSTFNGDEK